jgi:hypothetical protein
VAEPENAEIRLHQTVLYNSIYRADEQLLVAAPGCERPQLPLIERR